MSLNEAQQQLVVMLLHAASFLDSEHVEELADDSEVDSLLESIIVT